MICRRCHQEIIDERYIEYTALCQKCRKAIGAEGEEIGYYIWRSFYTNKESELTLDDIVLYCDSHSITYDRITLTGNEHAGLSVWLDLGGNE